MLRCQSGYAIQRRVCPFYRESVISATERLSATFLPEIRLLDRGIRSIEERCRFSIARFCVVPLADVPEQPTDLTQDSRRSDTIG
jgi:hypothetical protein